MKLSLKDFELAMIVNDSCFRYVTQHQSLPYTHSTHILFFIMAKSLPSKNFVEKVINKEAIHWSPLLKIDQSTITSYHFIVDYTLSCFNLLKLKAKSSKLF